MSRHAKRSAWRLEAKGLRARVYIAGPYSSGDVEANVEEAMAAAAALIEAGAAPFVPHLSHYLHARRPQPYEVWIEIDLAWLEGADALLRLPGHSPGADIEVGAALKRGILVFHSLEDAVSWVRALRL
jgi:nucleoside 2-deoxyribosyltransferase